MKKNISINISGIIFHIEEDGYEVLKKYLDSINKYFSSFEDSSEILSDIESRIAEIFLTKLNEGKQVITPEDVKSLVATMGSVSDFKAAEEQEFTETSTSTSGSKSGSHKTKDQHTQPVAKQLYRDQARKIVGGVCAGLGNYFNVDPVWVRLAFALLTVGWGFGLLVYLIMWIVVPGSYELDEPTVTKKLYRDNERKVLGGVAGGLAAYFGVDIVVIRLLFLITSFMGGLGFVTYIVLWIILPSAISITDKMQMQGEPVTLSNIESNIKKGLNVPEGEENLFVKILLFPFRLIGMILIGLGKILGPLVEVIRVAFGIFITGMGLAMVFGVIVSAGMLFGLLSGLSIIHWGVPFNEAALPIKAISQAIPTISAVAAFVCAIIPGIMIMLLGISTIAKKIVFNNMVGWSIFILFIVSVGVLSFTIPKIVYDFKEEGEVKIETVYSLNGKTLVLKLNEVGLDEYDAASLSFKGYDGTDVKLAQYFRSQGNSRQIAIQNTKMVDYKVIVEDSVFTFDSNLQFKKEAVFRAQRVDMTLFVPYNQPFVVEDNMYRLISHHIDYDKRNGNTWVITKEKNLSCISCPVEPSKHDDNADEESSSLLSNFTELEITGLFDLRITQSEEYSVKLIGRESEKRKYKIAQHGNTLVIEYDDNKEYDWKVNPLHLNKIRINISMPELESLELKGAGDVTFRYFDVDNLTIEALGALDIAGNVNANSISINLSGASKLELRGEGQSLDATIQGASQLKAYDYTTEDATVEANGVSSAKVRVTGLLEMKEGVASRISYRGNPAEVRKE